MTNNRSLKHALASRCLYDDLDVGKKQAESRQLVQVLQRLGLDHYKITEQESPDFFVSFSRGDEQFTIACELTALYSDSDARGSAEKKTFETWKKIAKTLRNRLDRAGHEYIYGVVFFKGDDAKALAAFNEGAALAEMEKVCGFYSSNPSDIIFPRDGFPILSQIMQLVRLFKYEERGILWWNAGLQTGMVVDPARALIETIMAKNKRAEKYSWQKAEEKWLIIVAGSNGLADMATNVTDLELLRHIGNVNFTGIILWDRWSDELIELFPIFRKLCDGTLMLRQLENLPQKLRPFTTGESEYPTKDRWR